MPTQSSIMRGIGAGMRVFEVLHRQPAIPYNQGDEVPKDHIGRIKFEHVFFEYPSRKGTPILKEFDLELKPGESVAIVFVLSFIVCYLNPDLHRF
jgi:ABC-type multidrug transport system fused ATPase/permease subunit